MKCWKLVRKKVELTEWRGDIYTIQLHHYMVKLRQPSGPRASSGYCVSFRINAAQGTRKIPSGRTCTAGIFFVFFAIQTQRLGGPCEACAAFSVGLGKKFGPANRWAWDARRLRQVWVSARGVQRHKNIFFFWASFIYIDHLIFV